MRLKREKLKLEAPTSFSRFLGYSNPKYELEWFHKLIADHCQMLLEGKIKNLMVFMPPQHGKSEIISRNFPAWALGQNPDLKIVGCSYSSDLAQQFSRSIQRTIDSKEYQAIFPATYLNGSNTRMDARGYLRNIDLFEMVGHRGFYKAVGVGGSLTGTPVDIAIIDDPVKDANEANSITLTPGTVTVALHGGRLCVYALDQEFAAGIKDSEFVRRLRRWEGKQDG